MCCVCGLWLFCGCERCCKSDVDCFFLFFKCYFMGICIFEILISLLMIIWLDIDSCYWDSDCFGIFRCLGG